MIDDRFGGLGHRLQEIILSGQIVPNLVDIGGPAGGVDPGLAGRGGNADRDVLDGTAEAAHGVPLEMREDNDEIVIHEVRAYNVIREVATAFDRQTHLPFGIHDVDRSDGRESVVGSRLQVVFGCGSAPAIGGVALDDRAVDRADQLPDQSRFQIVVAAGLSGRELHGNLFPHRLATERLVDGFQAFGRDVSGHIDLSRGL